MVKEQKQDTCREPANQGAHEATASPRHGGGQTAIPRNALPERPAWRGRRGHNRLRLTGARERT